MILLVTRTIQYKDASIGLYESPLSRYSISGPAGVKAMSNVNGMLELISAPVVGSTSTKEKGSSVEHAKRRRSLVSAISLNGPVTNGV